MQVEDADKGSGVDLVQVPRCNEVVAVLYLLYHEAAL